MIQKTYNPQDVWFARVVQSDNNEKVRPAVIVKTSLQPGNRLLVVYGQSKPAPDGRHVALMLDSRHNRNMKLTQDTYFRSSNVRLIRENTLCEKIGRLFLTQYYFF